ncbi:MAG TPA: AraC family transcriptional regulator [Prolixibacteraceae bacterium]|nr:AraC family transcriptional regulator [Prolixibacteraceae bacterium]
MILKIKNMVSDRCKTFVANELNKLGLFIISVEFGQVELSEKIQEEQLKLLDESLRNAGLELIEDKKSHVVNEIKNVVHHLIYDFDDLQKPNYSEYISQKIKVSYTHLSTAFSATEGITLEKYIIAQRIERIKELLIYSDMDLSDIAFKLHFSSVAHLSNQFKRVTGLTPSNYRNLRVR